MPYTLSENTVTFTSQGKVFSVSAQSCPVVFNSISRLISEGDVSQLESYSPSNILEQIGLTPKGNNQYEYEGTLLSKEMTRRVLSAYHNGEPVTPFIDFWKKAQSNNQLRLRDNLLGFIGTHTLPLTWDGNLILYKRSNWTKREDGSRPNSYEQFKLKWGPEFKEGRTVQGTNTVGTVGYVGSRCSDAGPIYDVEVNPQHILSIEYSSDDELIVQVSEYTYISLIDSKIDSWDNAGVYYLDTQITLEGNVVIRQPVTASSLSRFVAEGLEGRVKLEPQRVAVSGGSC